MVTDTAELSELPGRFTRSVPPTVNRYLLFARVRVAVALVIFQLAAVAIFDFRQIDLAAIDGDPTLGDAETVDRAAGSAEDRWQRERGTLNGDAHVGHCRTLGNRNADAAQSEVERAQRAAVDDVGG